MNEQPDKLFRDKVENFQLTVPSNAWNRVEANLDKKNNRGLWLKVAASLLLLAICTALLWPKFAGERTGQNMAAKKIEKPASDNKTQIDSKEKTVNTITTENISKSSTTSNIASNKTNRKHQPKKSTEKVKEKVIPNGPDLQENTSPENETPLENIQTETTVAAVEKKSPDRLSIVITAEEVNEKYLDKKSLAEATSAEKKSSTLRKLIDTAYDLKYNQDPFGDLRQKKNEILALNFKNEKQRSQNK